MLAIEGTVSRASEPFAIFGMNNQFVDLVAGDILDEGFSNFFVTTKLFRRLEWKSGGAAPIADLIAFETMRMGIY